MDKGAVRASRYKPDLVWRITGSVSLLLSLLSWKQRKLICCGHRVQHRVEYDVVRQLAQEMLKKIFVLAAAWHHRWAPKSEPLPTAGSNRVLLLLLDTLFFFSLFPHYYCWTITMFSRAVRITNPQYTCKRAIWTAQKPSAATTTIMRRPRKEERARARGWGRGRRNKCIHRC